MQTKITFANGKIDLQTLHHENMHQWWGDNVSEANYNLTFFKEGLATLGEYFFIAANAQAAAGGSAAAFEQSLVNTFNTVYAGSDLLWTGAPSDPRPYTLFSGSKTYRRPGIAYIALRLILGPANFNAAFQQIQSTYRQWSVSEAQLESAFESFLPVPSASCRARLGLPLVRARGPRGGVRRGEAGAAPPPPVRDSFSPTVAAPEGSPCAPASSPDSRRALQRSRRRRASDGSGRAPAPPRRRNASRARSRARSPSSSRSRGATRFGGAGRRRPRRPATRALHPHRSPPRRPPPGPDHAAPSSPGTGGWPASRETPLRASRGRSPRSRPRRVSRAVASASAGR